MQPKTIRAKINGKNIRVPAGLSILDAAKQAQIKIPTLCKHPDLPATAACGLCIVKIKDSKKLLRSCCTTLEEGMDIITHDPEIVEVRKTVLELILSNHPNDCLQCGRSYYCELQKLTADFAIQEELFEKIVKNKTKDTSTKSIVLEPAKCIRCGRCVEVCQQIQDVWALGFLSRGINMRIAPAGDLETANINLAESPCVRCGQCSAHCPTGAIFEYDQTETTWAKLRDENNYCVAQIAPAVRVAIGESFGYPIGTNLTKKLYAVLRRLGFKAVFDTNFGADVTIVEEATEFVQRFAHKKGPLPLITSCCPSWVDFMEKYIHGAIDLFSSCKSPHEMVGALAKTYFAEKNKIDPKRICVVSIMPCTSKKFEIIRSQEMFSSGQQDVDLSLTTRELARMIRQAGIDFKNLPDEEPDHILGDYAGGGTIFGTTGGVMEAALRTAYNMITGENLKNVEIDIVRGLQRVKEGTIDIKGTKVRVAVAHGLGNVRYLMNKVLEAKKNNQEPPYHFIEVMACPGGCVAGGGQPYGVTDDLRIKRAQGLYEDDRDQKVRCCHDNPYIQKLYDEFLGKPLSEKSHHLLHTSYIARKTYLK
ncbi:MAG TPA: NADH-dependent [FeFe] hydrogenase, group A6 [Candidatus Omnitrophota bacterium]|nr:NADH-dependent [FeFe] hydrogenase, group A6 [Candidatus Omnitrophota bacterium]